MKELIQLWEDLLRDAAQFPGSMVTWRAQAEGAKYLFCRLNYVSNKELAREAQRLWDYDYRLRFDSVEEAHNRAIDRMYEED